MAVATINDKVILGSSPVRWTFREGVRPTQHIYELSNEDADALYKEAQEGSSVTLTMDLGNDNPEKIEHLWVLNLFPGEDPFKKRVLLSDRRWFWKYRHVRRLYNIRRDVGFKRVNPDAPKELQSVVSRVWYAAFSLKNPTVSDASGKWNAMDMIRDVLNSASLYDKEGAPNIVIKGTFSRDIPIDNLEIDDQGDQALERALAFIPEARIWINEKGEAVIYSRASGGERAVVESFPPEMVGMGHIDFVKNNITRPAKIRVLFTPEVEVRFDFIENSSAAVSNTTVVGQLDTRRRLDNVLPVPDFELHLQGQDSAVSQGTWITFDQAMTSSEWQNPPGVGRLDHDVLQRAFVPFMDIWTPMLETGQLQTNVIQANWAPRIAAMQSHYRKTFRIYKEWMDRALSIRAYLVATVDFTSGQRAPAIAYSDYCSLPSQRAKFMDLLGGTRDATYACNITGYPTDPLDITTGKVAPAEVSIVDPDQGIIHIEYKLDVYRMMDMILPSNIDPATMPQGKLTQNGRPIAFNQASSSTQIPKLTASHKIAILITAVPGAPHDEWSLYAIDVAPKDIASLIPPAALDGLNDAQGPTMEVRVGPGLETARVRWLDSRSADIEAIFGIPNGATPNLKGLVVNEDTNNDPRNGASLNAIAKAIAARIYASFVDRYQGEATTALLPGVQLDGWLQEIAHEVSRQGVVTTKITLPAKLEKFDLISYLDPSTRSILMRMPQG